MPAHKSVLLNNHCNKESRARFDAYRKRVRAFQVLYSPSHSSVTHSEAGRKAALQMCHLLRREELFPNLRELQIHGRRVNDMDALIPFLLGPSLRSVRLRDRTPPPDQLYPLVATLAPHVEHLDLGDGVESWLATNGTTGTIPLEYLSCLQHIKSLAISTSRNGQWTIKMSDIVLLLRMPHLTYLSLTANHILNDWSLSTNNNLHIVAPIEFKLEYNPTPSTGLQNLSCLPFATSLSVSLNPRTAPPLELASFLSAVASNTTLRAFAMLGEGTSEILTVDAEDLVPLFSSQTLQNIRLVNVILTSRRATGFDTPLPPPGASALHPSSAVIDLIITALKKNQGGTLKDLSLPEATSSTIPTFDSLIKFAEHVPRLEALAIGVSLLIDIPVLQRYSQMRFNNSLRRLTIGNIGDPTLSTDDYKLLAKCIDAWFPNLDWVRFHQTFKVISCVNKFRLEWKNSRLTTGSGVSGKGVPG
ncbi:hypothetical protein BKA70DRAFT_1568100 [Coprinopsis sp. MPI-PUGE-AT-0042]|nr:hypothetical protein BKA70DRAFT_1568100 [Coprinopsis sp. MPI-PUGE-AT-0042]